MISYRNFEDLTLRRRLAIAAGHHARLRRILHARKVLTSPERARLWTVLIQSAQLYALEAVAVTKEGMRLLHVQTTKHLRGIFGAARHIDGCCLLSKVSLGQHDMCHSHSGVTACAVAWQVRPRLPCLASSGKLCLHEPSMFGMRCPDLTMPRPVGVRPLIRPSLWLPL